MLQKREWVFLAIGILLGLAAYHFAVPLVFPPVAAVFSPDDGDRVIALVDSAHATLDIEMYVFTSQQAVQALERAHDRGVRVRLILERRTLNDDNERIFNELTADGIEARWASEGYKLTHAKFFIVDGSRVLVGSHNWSNSALYNNREASVIVSGSVVEDFRRAFEKDWMLAA